MHIAVPTDIHSYVCGVEREKWKKKTRKKDADDKKKTPF